MISLASGNTRTHLAYEQLNNEQLTHTQRFLQVNGENEATVKLKTRLLFLSYPVAVEERYISFFIHRNIRELFSSSS